MDRLSNVLAIFSLSLMVFVLASLRRQHIRVEYSVSWIAAAAALLVMSGIPDLRNWLASFLGINDPGMAVLITIGVVFFAVFYRFTIMVSNLKDANIALTQRVAILEFHLRSRNEKQQ
jgi:hypothetical protein